MHNARQPRRSLARSNRFFPFDISLAGQTAFFLFTLSRGEKKRSGLRDYFDIGAEKNILLFIHSTLRVAASAFSGMVCR